MDRTIIIGRLTTEPVIHYGGKYEEVCTFTISDRTFDDSDNPRIHKIAAFKNQALACRKLHRGDLCLIEGVIQGRYEKTTILAKEVTFIRRINRHGIIETDG